MAKPTISDSLKTAKIDLMQYLGKDLYSILESGKVKANVWGVKSNIDFRKQNINFQKNFGKDYRFDLDINKQSKYNTGFRDDISFSLIKKF